MKTFESLFEELNKKVSEQAEGSLTVEEVMKWEG